MADDDTMAMIDLNKRVFSGAPLSPTENAKLRELIQDRERSKWLKRHSKLWLTTVVTIPAAIVGFYIAGQEIINGILKFVRGH